MVDHRGADRPGYIGLEFRANRIEILLWNFISEDHHTRAEHITWLRTRFVPFFRDRNFLKISVYGIASQRGSHAYNMRLSEQRREDVIQHLREMGVRGDLTGRGTGELFARGDENVNADWDRGVLIVLAPPEEPRPEPPPAPPSPPVEKTDPKIEPVSRRFAIRIERGAGVGYAVAQGQVLNLCIWDTTWHSAAYYVYQGGGVTTPGLPYVPPVPSVTGRSIWHCFETTVGMQTKDFEGVLHMKTLTIPAPPPIPQVITVYDRVDLILSPVGKPPIVLPDFKTANLVSAEMIPNRTEVSGPFIWLPRMLYGSRQIQGCSDLRTDGRCPCANRVLNMRRFGNAVCGSTS